MKSAVLLSSLLVLWDVAAAIRLPIVGKRSLERRASSITGTAALTDDTDVEYTTNITLGGVQFTVLIDTGSSDLWVSSTGSIPGAVNTGKSASVEYAVGGIRGPIELASLQFAGYSVPHQAFIYVTPDNTYPDGTGLIGLGPSSGSEILYILNSSTGNPPLDNIFLLDITTPNFLSILLGRADEPGNPFPGEITVGDILPGYEAISSQPKLDVSVVSLAEYGNQHWQTLLDEDGIIGPNGKPIPATTVVSPTNDSKKLTAVFDSGFSLPQVPQNVADAFYGWAQGAQFVNVTGLGGIWTLPCRQEVNFAFKMGGKTYPVHPLDAVMEPVDLGFNPFQNSQGVEMCFGSFQPVSFQAASSYDLILGMAFLRNTYFLVNFGDFILGSSNTAPPYIQLLSTTNNSAQAHSDFVAVRGNNPAAPATVSWFKAHAKALYAIGATILAAIAMFAIAIYCCCRRGRNRSQQAYSMKPVFGSYAPLNQPAPVPATDLYMSGQPAWNPQQHSGYSEPWGPKY